MGSYLFPLRRQWVGDAALRRPRHIPSPEHRTPLIARPDPARRRAVVLALIAAGLLAIVAIGPFHEELVRWIAAAGELLGRHPVLGMVVFILLAAASAMVAFVSSAVLLPAALEVWSEPVCVALLWVGWIGGGMLAYLIAKQLGRPAVRRLASSRALERFEKLVSSRTSFGMVLLFQLGVPSEIPGYLFGLARYPVLRFLGALAIAELPYALVTVYAGSAFVARRMVPLLVLMAATAVIGIVAFQAVRRHADRHEGGSPA